MSAFSLGLTARLRRYWPAGVVIGVAVSFVALTMLLSSAGRESLLGPVETRSAELKLVSLPTYPAAYMPELGDGQVSEPASVVEPLSTEQVASLAAQPGVAWVEATVAGSVFAQIESRRSNQLDLATTAVPENHRNWQLAGDGRLPTDPTEIAVSQNWAQISGVSLGDWLPIINPALEQSRELLVVGQVAPKGQQLLAEARLAGQNSAIVVPSLAEELLGLESGQTLEAAIKLDPGANRDSVRLELEPLLPAGYRLVDVYDPGQEIIVGLTVFVSIFVFLAILVAVFVIVNIFRIILSSQVRDLATLRLLGATRDQTLRRLLTESAIVALVVGVLSVVLARLLVALALPLVNNRWDLELLGPNPNLWYWVLPILVGLGATLAGALLPAITASRRRPVTALGQVIETPTPKKAIARTIIGASLTGLSLFGLLVIPRLYLASSGLVGFLLFVAGLGLLLGLALVSAGLARPFGFLLGWLGRPLGGVIWRLGAGNIGRQPARSAAVANSLLIGVSLITTVTILASSFQVASQQLLDHYFPSDWLIIEKFDSNLLSGLADSVDYEQEQIAPDLADRILNSDLLESPSAVRFGQGVGIGSIWPDVGPGEGDKWTLNVGGFDPQTIEQNFNYNFEPQAVGDILADGQVLIESNLTGSFDPGQKIRVDYPGTGYQVDYIIGGTFVDSDYDLILSNDQYLTAVGKPGLTFIAGDSAAGLTAAEARAGLEQLLVDSPSLAAYDLRTDIKIEIDRIINAILNVLRGLLGLSLLVAVLGIFSTLVLSVRERQREIGVLRAIGLTRPQVVGLIIFEGVAMALFGAVLGLLAGWLGGFVLIELIRQDPSLAEFLSFSLPWLTFVFYGLLAAVLGGLAALVPALLAVRRSVVDCLTRD